MKTIAVIDGNSLMHRAFHAVPPYMTAPDGRPTNACFGFLSMLLKLAGDFKPDGIICAFDHGIPSFRLKAVEKYKAQRPPTDPDLKTQFPIIKRLLTAMGIPVVELDGWEGDDILGTLSARGEAEGLRTLLVTGDKDALQLASELTSIVNTKTGMSDVVIYDPAGVVEKWGIGPELVADYLGLMGDSSDNIPGVPGVGPKTATKLLQEYGSLEEVLAHADELKGKLGENVRNNAEQALASREVATIIRNVDVPCDLAAVSFPAFDVATVTQAFEEFALNTQLKKVLELVDATPAPTQQSEELTQLEAQPLVIEAQLTGDAAHTALDEALKNKEELAVYFAAAEGDSLFDAARQLYVARENNILLLIKVYSKMSMTLVNLKF